MDKPTAAILLTLVVHFLGIVALLWLALDGERLHWRGWWPGDDGGGGDDGPAADPPSPRGGGLPRPAGIGHVLGGDAVPAAVRLRTEHERLERRRVRRPQHVPEPARPREPAAS